MIPDVREGFIGGKVHSGSAFWSGSCLRSTGSVLRREVLVGGGHGLELCDGSEGFPLDVVCGEGGISGAGGLAKARTGVRPMGDRGAAFPFVLECRRARRAGRR